MPVSSFVWMSTPRNLVPSWRLLPNHVRQSGVAILRPPRDGRMAFIQSPDSVELLQRGEALPPAEPWASMANQGTW
jgi:lactoylglutathione lyase